MSERDSKLDADVAAHLSAVAAKLREAKAACLAAAMTAEAACTRLELYEPVIKAVRAYFDADPDDDACSYNALEAAWLLLHSKLNPS
jgi:hypothetical protein